MPPRVVAAVVELVYGGLAREPRRVGTPLRFELDGLHAARRTEYRIVSRISDDDRARDGIVRIVSVGHRRTIYRRRQ